MSPFPVHEDRCSTCEYFIQHYVWHHGRYTAANGGHCIQKKRFRQRRGTDSACENWVPQSEEYKQSRTPDDCKPSARVPAKEYCIRVQVFEET